MEKRFGACRLWNEQSVTMGIVGIPLDMEYWQVNVVVADLILIILPDVLG
jgi:hypothetical protein